jgi:hypothetical protein
MSRLRAAPAICKYGILIVYLFSSWVNQAILTKDQQCLYIFEQHLKNSDQYFTKQQHCLGSEVITKDSDTELYANEKIVDYSRRLNPKSSRSIPTLNYMRIKNSGQFSLSRSVTLDNSFPLLRHKILLKYIYILLWRIFVNSAVDGSNSSAFERGISVKR